MRKVFAVFTHLLAFVLALLMTACMVLGGIGMIANAALTDRSLHLGVALDDTVIDWQMARITEKVAVVAEKCYFSPETIAHLISREEVCAYNTQVIDWWMTMLRDGEPANFPLWTHEELEMLIREDPLFQENVSTYQRKAFARDEAAGGVGTAVSEAVTPLRTELVDFMTVKLLPKVNVAKYMALLPYLLPGSLAAALVLWLLIWGVVPKRRRMALYGGSALLAAALLLLGGMDMVYDMDIPGMIAHLSEPLALQTSLLLQALQVRLGGYSAACLLTGLVMMLIWQLGGRKPRKEQA